MSKIKTTHVGSLPRPAKVAELILARENKQPYDQSEFDACMTEYTAVAVAKQVEAGVDIISDGEMSKISYSTYIKDRYDGFSGDIPRTIPHDMTLFPTYIERVANSAQAPSYSRPECTGAIKIKADNNDLEKDLHNFKNALSQHGVEQKNAFMTCPSPGIISFFMRNQYYPSREVYLSALADMMQAEYEAIVDAGFTLQLDCPDLALSRHVEFHDLTDAEFVKIAMGNMEALNHALRNIPAEKIRMHICWGNYEAPHCCDIGMEKVFDVVMDCKASHILFEASNPRHAHEWEIFADRKSDIPHDKILIPGVIDSTSNFIEHPRVIKQRLENFTNIVGTDRVMAGSDCGFGTLAGYEPVVAEIAYAKLKSLSEGAALVG